jgi:hypothetical protein
MTIFQNLTEIFPIFSLIFSLILMVGLYQLGEVIFYNNNIKQIFLSVSDLKYQKTLIAINFLMIIILPIVLYLSYSKQILSFFSILLFIFGLFKIITSLKKNLVIKKDFLNLNLNYFIFVLVILGLFLITFSPVNHSDSLDYHLGGAQYVFKTGRLPTVIESYTNLLVGAGESLNSLGLFFGAEQFGNLIQFSGLLSLIGIFKKFNNKKYFLLLLILTSPMIIFLVSSPKPQLFHLCSNALLFVMIFINFDTIKKTKYSSFELIIVSNIFLINSINSKFSYILSSFIIYFVLIILSYKKNFFIKMTVINSIFISVFFLGFAYWKYMTWGGNFFNYIINPLPMHLDGVKLFHEYLINYNRNNAFVHLFFPKSFGEYTEAIGIGVLTFIYFFLQKNRLFFKFIPIFLFFILVNHFFGQASSRFYFEIYVWMILLLASTYSLKFSKKFQFIFYIQFLTSICAIWVGVFTMSYGFLNKNLRDNVMTNTANGYSLYKWSNETFENKEARVLSMHRSISLGKGNIFSTAFQYFLISPPDKIHTYHVKNILKDFPGPTYLLTYGNEDEVGIFSNCIDYLYLSKKNVGRHVGRNPFNKSGAYNGYIYKLKDLNETNCLNQLTRN